MSAPVGLRDYCRDCNGTGVTRDEDGSGTGDTDALIPCSCAAQRPGDSLTCGCYFSGWPFSRGFLGWIPNGPDAVDAGEAYYRPCPDHHNAASFVAEDKELP